MKTRVPGIRRPRRGCAFALAALLAGCQPSVPRIENVVLVSLDTTRRDHLSVYGYPRETTPRLDAIADRCAVFDVATAQATITRPSHASILTGLYPHTHQLGENTRPLDDRFVTLAEVLAERGWQTGAFISGFPLRKARGRRDEADGKITFSGLDQGFQTYDSRFPGIRRDGVETTRRAVEWIRRIGPEESYFALVHLYDAHGPYTSSDAEVFRSEGAGRVLDMIPKYQQLDGPDGEPLTHLNDYVDRYDDQVRKQDELVGRLLDVIDLDTTLLVVTADHGETLGDRDSPLNLNHGTSLFEEQIAIPLLFCGPRVVPGRYPQVVETVDIMPTILDLIDDDLSAQLAMQGQSLVALFRGAGSEYLDDTAFASNDSRPEIYQHHGYVLADDRSIHTVRRGRWKLIRYPGIEAPYIELYDLESDPSEQRNVAVDRPDVVETLGRVLDDWLIAEPETAPSENLSEEDRRKLEALGYVGD